VVPGLLLRNADKMPKGRQEAGEKFSHTKSATTICCAKEKGMQYFCVNWHWLRRGIASTAGC